MGYTIHIPFPVQQGYRVLTQTHMMRAWRKHHVTNHSCVPRWLEVLYLNDLYYLDVEMLRQEGGGAMSVGWSIWSPQNTVKWVFPMVVPQKSAGFPTKSNMKGTQPWKSPQIHPQNPGFMTTAGWFSCPQVRAWQPVTADSAPAARHSHSAVLDAQRMWVFGGHVGQGPRSQHSWWLHPLLVVIVEVFSPTSTICATFMLRRGSWEGKRVSVCEFRYLSAL